MIEVPDAPGHGVEFAAGAIERFAVRPSDRQTIPRPRRSATMRPA